MSDFPRLGDTVIVKNSNSEGKLTGFERDGRIRVKVGEGPGAPIKTHPENLATKPKTQETTTTKKGIRFAASVPTPAGPFSVTVEVASSTTTAKTT